MNKRHHYPTLLEREANELDLELFNLKNKLVLFIEDNKGRINAAGLETVQELKRLISILRHQHIRPLMDEETRKATNN